MPILTLRLPAVNCTPSDRPTTCPTCASRLLVRWGRPAKPVRDPQLQWVTTQRDRCLACRHAFRLYPTGVDRATQTLRLRHLAALTWALGLSLNAVVAVFGAFGLALGRSSVWRDGQELAARLQTQRRQQPVRVVGLDGTGMPVRGQPGGVVVAVDLGRGVPVSVAVLDERDPNALLGWLRPLVQQLGVEVIVTDDLASYRPVAHELCVYHQVCQVHVRRWVGKAVRELAPKRGPLVQRWVPEVREVLRTLRPDGGVRLLARARLLKAKPGGALW
jgi:hypothetical protein